MRSTQSPPIPAHAPILRRASRFLALCAGIACFAPAPASAQTMQWFGEWAAAVPAARQLYVSSGLGAAGNPGTLAAPLDTISGALALATTNGWLGTVPVTINVMSGTYTFPGEAFPIALPAHGVSIESYSLAGAPRPIVDASLFPARDTFVFNTLGTPALPDSVLRGLDIRNIAQTANSTEVRIEVPLGGMEPGQRVAPEIRNCIISGGASVGVDIVSTEDVIMEAVVERNEIRFEMSKEPVPAIGVRVTGGTAPSSPVIRSNYIESFQTNVLFTGGGNTNQPRLQANFIQVGEINVSCDSCEPTITGNTIAFAFEPSGAAAGITWTGIAQMTLANNLIWNPAHGAMFTNPPDIVGSLANFLMGDPLRGAWFNYDEDDILATAGLPFVNLGPLTTGPLTPDFVGGGGSGATPVDLHLFPTSGLREMAFIPEHALGFSGFGPLVVFGAPAPIVVRRDHSFDIDFDARISGFGTDVGADEVTAILGPVASSGTRGASIAPTVGSASGSDIDIIGSLLPTPAGTWSTDVDLIGTPGDLVMLISGVGFFDLTTDPAFPGPLLENTAVFQNLLADGSVVPGMLTTASFSLDIVGGSVTVGFALIPASGSVPMNVNFGAVNPAFLEAEAHLQAVFFDPTATLIQTTNRLSLDLNE